MARIALKDGIRNMAFTLNRFTTRENWHEDGMIFNYLASENYGPPDRCCNLYRRRYVGYLVIFQLLVKDSNSR